MKSKFFLALTTLTVACSMLLTVIAQDKIKLDPNKITYVTKKVMLPCRNAGGHQDVAKVMDITNNSGHVIKKDTLIYYSASDGDQGKQYPDGPVVPGKNTVVHGRPGQNYTCQAWVYELK